ncbi:hypothetical protein [Alteraurantiacibacter buctensis]|uniref:Uncharacterized protein n=1 Tax=Alteraurantiacibacter buctensis TaxID=1503981 RepID=A0A844YZ72_9SPHN|nr:hypothetical protein [Alteraurantiacibacter buctensis]MXO71764.1 hypothetical protein [Alteraurantiacibacter buctensis]
MPIRSAADAEAEIGHHFAGLAQVGREAHAFFQSECRSVAPLMESRTRASLYRDIIVRKLRDYCDGTAGAHLHRKNQLTLIGLESLYALRVKRLAAGFSVGVSPTRASEQYDANEMPEYATDLFPDAPAATLLYFGWSVPENAPNEFKMYLVCNDANRDVLWAIALDDGEDDGRGISTPLPLDGDDAGVGIRVLVKGNERKANG